MAEPTRLDIFFGIGDFGWSTTHYFYTTTASLTDPQFVAHSNTLVNLYAKMLAYGIVIDAARASQANVWRDSTFFVPPKITNIVAGGTSYQVYNNYVGNGPATDPFDCINFRLEMGPAYRSAEIIGGWPAGSLKQPSIYPWSNLSWAPTYQLLQDLMEELTGTRVEGQASVAGGYWGGYVRAKGTDGPALTAVNTITCAVPGVMTLTCAGIPTVNNGAAIRLLGATQPPNVPHIRVNGTYNVLTGGGTNVLTVANPAIQIGQVIFGAAATLQPIVLVLQPYDKWNFVNQTHRKRGRRFGAPRGRSKRRAPGAVV